MQNMFANLALTNQDHYVPRPFWNAFKDYDGQHLNLREHQDAYEFFTRLQVLPLPSHCPPTMCTSEAVMFAKPGAVSTNG